MFFFFIGYCGGTQADSEEDIATLKMNAEEQQVPKALPNDRCHGCQLNFPWTLKEMYTTHSPDISAGMALPMNLFPVSKPTFPIQTPCGAAFTTLREDFCYVT